MPCFYTGSAEGDRAYGLEEVVKEQKKELDRLTRLLCEAGRAHHNKRRPNQEVRAWWVSHRCADEKRGEKW